MNDENTPTESYTSILSTIGAKVRSSSTSHPATSVTLSFSSKIFSIPTDFSTPSRGAPSSSPSPSYTPSLSQSSSSHSSSSPSTTETEIIKVEAETTDRQVPLETFPSNDATTTEKSHNENEKSLKDYLIFIFMGVGIIILAIILWIILRIKRRF